MYGTRECSSLEKCSLIILIPWFMETLQWCNACSRIKSLSFQPIVPVYPMAITVHMYRCIVPCGASLTGVAR